MGAFSGEPIPLTIPSGIFSEETQVGAGARWFDADRIRFKNGLPESIGGWVKQTLSDVLLGIPRSIHDWTSLDGTKFIAVGTEKRLYLINEALAVFNITPIRDSDTDTDIFSTDTAGAYDPNSTGDASYFSVGILGHGVSVGDIVTFSGFSAVGGLDPNGDFEVQAVTDTDNFVLKHSSDATSTVSGGGGAGNYIFEIPVGSALSAVQKGFGTGLYGAETYGTPRSESTFLLQLRTWSLDNWGEDLIASPRGGSIFVWDKSAGTSVRAQIISNAPITNQVVLVSQETRQLIALGAHDGSQNDPLFIAWSDTEDYDTWVAASTNNAGDSRINKGSEIVSGFSTKVGILILTDVGMHVMQPVASNEVFVIRPLGSGIAVAGPAASVDVNGVGFSMGKNNFYVYDGVISVMPCSVWGHVFRDLNVTQSFSVMCSHSKDFNEIWWFYPSANQNSNDRYVIFNYVEKIWYYGSLGRASFHDFSPFFNKPYGFDNQGNLYVHEEGSDDDVAAMGSFIESGYLPISRMVVQINKMIPDFKTLIGSVSLILKGRKRPQGETITKGPYAVSSVDDEVGARIRARHVALRIEQDGIGERFRMGTWGAEAEPDGDR
jgi:hypothetical protein